jgi:hypothetical protein
MQLLNLILSKVIFRIEQLVKHGPLVVVGVPGRSECNLFGGSYRSGPIGHLRFDVISRLIPGGVSFIPVLLVYLHRRKFFTQFDSACLLTLSDRV